MIIGISLKGQLKGQGYNKTVGDVPFLSQT